MSFKVGDRVAAYWEADGPTRTVGVVDSVKAAGEIVHVEVIDDGCDGQYFKAGSGTQFHVKQCRRLVKRERRRVWVKFDEDSGMVNYTATSPNGVGKSDEVVEFIEVRKK